jgi:hypothetical protein
VVGGVLWQSEVLPPCEKRPASLSILLRRGSRSSRPKVTVSASDFPLIFTPRSPVRRGVPGIPAPRAAIPPAPATVGDAFGGRAGFAFRTAFASDTRWKMVRGQPLSCPACPRDEAYFQ